MSNTVEQKLPSQADDFRDDDFDFDTLEQQEITPFEVKLEDYIGSEYSSEIGFANTVSIKILKIDGDQAKIAVKNENKPVIGQLSIEENVFNVSKDDLVEILQKNGSLAGSGINKIASLVSNLAQSREKSTFVKKVAIDETNF